LARRSRLVGFFREHGKTLIARYLGRGSAVQVQPGGSDDKGQRYLRLLLAGKLARWKGRDPRLAQVAAIQPLQPAGRTGARFRLERQLRPGAKGLARRRLEQRSSMGAGAARFHSTVLYRRQRCNGGPLVIRWGWSWGRRTQEGQLERSDLRKQRPGVPVRTV